MTHLLSRRKTTEINSKNKLQTKNTLMQSRPSVKLILQEIKLQRQLFGYKTTAINIQFILLPENGETSCDFPMPLQSAVSNTQKHQAAEVNIQFACLTKVDVSIF